MIPLDLQRAARLLLVALKYGLLLAIRNRLWPGPNRNRGVRLRQAIEQLGLTYLKLGQFMAMRYDVIPAEIADELARLFERVSPIPFEQVKLVVETELGGPIEAFYREFDRQPTASASVAQVHRALTRAGDPVAVKVQRPGVLPLFLADSRNIRRLAALVNASGLLGINKLVETIDDFIKWTLPELNFLTEGGTADRLRHNALSFEIVPVVHWQLTTTRLLTLEFINGVSLAELSRDLDADGKLRTLAALPNLDLRLVLHRLAVASMRQLFETGFFHGDPHPGNILVRDDNTVAFVDFGIFGELSRTDLLTLRSFIESIAIGDIPRALRYYLKQLQSTVDTDERAFREAAQGVLRSWYEASRNAEITPVQERHLGKTAGEMMELTRRYGLRMTMNSLLWWRALTALDSTALRFPNHFDLLVEMRSFFEPTPEQVADELAELSRDPVRAVAQAELLLDGPAELQRLLLALLEENREWPVQQEESRQEVRANNGRARAAALMLVALSLALLGLGGPVEATTRGLVLGLAGPLGLWSIVEFGSR